MAILGFKHRFRPRILKRVKNQTIRSFRKYPILPMEILFLYTGLRTRNCKKIGEAQCVGTNTITLTATSYTLHQMLPITFNEKTHLNAFARSDGFTSWKALVKFWYEEHGRECFPFTGTIIYFSLLPKSEWKAALKTRQYRKLLKEQYA